MTTPPIARKRPRTAPWMTARNGLFAVGVIAGLYESTCWATVWGLAVCIDWIEARVMK